MTAETQIKILGEWTTVFKSNDYAESCDEAYQLQQNYPTAEVRVIETPVFVGRN